MHAGAVDRAAEHLVETDHAMAVVEEQATEHFVITVAQPRAQPSRDRDERGVADTVAVLVKTVPLAVPLATTADNLPKTNVQPPTN